MRNLDLIDGWAIDQRRRGLMPSTITRRATMIRSFARWADPQPLQVCEEDHVQRFLDARRIGARTRYTWISALHTFYGWAVRAGYVPEDPTGNIARPKLRRTLPRPITDADLAHAIHHAPAEIRCWLILASYGGLRCAEIAGLHRDDILWDIGKMQVLGKGGKERVVPMHPLVADAMANCPTPRANRHLFQRPAGGPWPPALLSRTGNLYLHDVGVNATMHQLRHWFATRTLAKCRNVRTVQELLGHASITTTAIYTAFTGEEGVAAVEALDAPATPDPQLFPTRPRNRG